VGAPPCRGALVLVTATTELGLLVVAMLTGIEASEGGGSLGHGQWQKGWFADEGVGREVEVRGKPEEDGRRRLNGDTEEASPNGKTGKGLRGRVTPRQTFVSSVRCSSDNAGSKK
jgi:hypothetical protein